MSTNIPSEDWLPAERLSRVEQLQMIATVDRYLEEHLWSHRTYPSTWSRGFQVHSEIVVNESEQVVRQANVDAFLQVVETGERMEAYRISMVRVGDEAWQVFQTLRV
ncbi:hypothetical protein [Tumebacillus permanentifrigoris]|uniref:Uncharacterized protein n=1 Tax=Tumebacillus permanentifrigoris TaxID=378543 RepID=A0A316D664_9BACL|nr:hypothetical protein [Tumebacillus permanentifrigoris]PWK10220.1 hypothetical protein C7459_11241 [Tumebacillus permanentifrigoris]